MGCVLNRVIMNLFEARFRKLFNERPMISEADEEVDNGTGKNVESEKNEKSGSLESVLSGDTSQDTDNEDVNALADGLDAGLGLNGSDASEAAEMANMLKSKLEQRIKASNDQIKEWATKIDQFAAFINDSTDENSIRYFFQKAAPGSVLYAVKEKANSEMTKVAKHCALLAEELKALVGSVDVNSMLGNK